VTLELTVGTSLPPRRIENISTEAMKTMGVILADPNQIHLDVEAANAAGYDRVVNQGPSNCGYLLDLLHIAFPHGRIRRFSARFLGIVFGGDDVEGNGRIESVESANGTTSIFCSVWLENQHGDRVVEATAVMELAPQKGTT
jgi:acyl dehydratase